MASALRREMSLPGELRWRVKGGGCGLWVGWVAMMAVGKAGRQSRAAETHWHVALLALSCLPPRPPSLHIPRRPKPQENLMMHLDLHRSSPSPRQLLSRITGAAAASSKRILLLFFYANEYYFCCSVRLRACLGGAVEPVNQFSSPIFLCR